METARQQWFIIDAETVVAIHRRAAEMGAMVSLFQRNIFGACGFAAQTMVLTRKAQTGFDRIRSTRCEKHP